MEGIADQLSIIYRVLIAIILSGCVGFEREHLQKPAGLRTNMIIGGSACLIVSLAPVLILYIENLTTQEMVQADPIRLLHAMVVGVSFIGAGTIIKSGDEKISGLTTAATLLFSMAIGAAVAIEQYIIGIGITVIVLIINLAVRKITIPRSLDKDNEQNQKDES